MKPNRPVKSISVGHVIKESGQTVEEKNEIVAQRAGVSDLNLDSSVTLSVGLTENMGDYRSIKVNVSVTLPCANDSQERHKAITLASHEVQHYIAEEMRITKERFYDLLG